MKLVHSRTIELNFRFVCCYEIVIIYLNAFSPQINDEGYCDGNGSLSSDSHYENNMIHFKLVTQTCGRE